MIVKYIAMRAVASIAMLSAMVLSVSLGAGAQGTSLKTEGGPPGMERQQGSVVQPGAQHPLALSATLVDPEKKAPKHEATVVVRVAGIQLVDPAQVNEQPAEGQGHLHYQLDSGPLIATTAPKLSFHELSAGEHRITVKLVGNDHKPLGPQEILTLTIPQGPGSRAQRQ